jgi:hypothetical protein
MEKNFEFFHLNFFHFLERLVLIQITIQTSAFLSVYGMYLFGKVGKIKRNSFLHVPGNKCWERKKEVLGLLGGLVK